MNGKQLDSMLGSILNKYPAATAEGQNQIFENKATGSQVQQIDKNEKSSSSNEISRIAIEVPQLVKDEIKSYIKKNKGLTEKTLILQALRNFGFTVIKEEWFVDKRSTR